MKIIAFYLPQYYSFPENDEWWGKGFTEWTNVKKSRPLFRGHYQPTIPLNENFYCLENADTFKWQAELAKKYGVYGFCFYEYYFGNGRYLMEKPLEVFLENKDIDINFCLCWANHTWSRTWTGEDKEILMSVNYDDEVKLKSYFNYLLRFFRDDRYIKINNMPVFVIYVPEQIPQLIKYKSLFNEWSIEAGFDGIIFVSQNPEVVLNREKYINTIDYSIVYEPNYSVREFRDFVAQKKYFKAMIEYPRMFFDVCFRHIKKTFRTVDKDNLSIIDYPCVWKKIIKRDYGKDLWPCGFVNVDTTPRKGYAGQVTKWNSPRKFGIYLRKLMLKNKNIPFTFIMAWNEWGEGAYLEPDERFMFKYLEEIQNALEKTKSISYSEQNSQNKNQYFME